jgi:MYXO-CTERM domain-containing protein
MTRLVLLSLLVASAADAKTLYVAKTGSDTANACTSQGSPCATIAQGVASMAGGDTLVISDGVYAEQIRNPPAGSAGAYTTVQAEHDWGVTIDGSGFPNNFMNGIHITTGSYIVIRGFHVKMNQANDTNEGVIVTGVDHVKIQRCSVAYSGTFGNVGAFDVGPAAYYVLIEECYAYGGARYPFIVYQSTHAIVRRCVSRLDYWNGSLQAANFTNYNGDMTLWQNNIAIDSDNANIGGSGLYGGFFDENKLPDASWSGTATRLTHRGNIVLNVQPYFSGIYDYDISNLHTYSDDIVWDSHGGFYGDYIHGDAPVLDAQRFTIGRIRGTYDGPNGQGSAGTGFFIGPGASATIVSNTLSHSILWHNPSFGVADYAASDYDSFFANGADYGGTLATPAAGAHDRSDDLTAGLMYLPRPEPGSTLATAGIGASIIYMWGATGTLWGDPGYDTITAEPLWPFPNEGVIRSDMASYVGPGGAGARGFTAGTSLDGSPQTLTKYIWEYLGNQIPPDVYGFHIVTDSLPSGTVALVYTAQVVAAGGTPPYQYGLMGALPPGLGLNINSGTITGTPTAPGTTSFTLTATDSSTPAKMATAAVQMVVQDAGENAGANGDCGCRVGGQTTGGSAFVLLLLLLALLIIVR